MNRIIAILTSVLLFSPQLVFASELREDHISKAFNQLNYHMQKEEEKAKQRVRDEFLRNDFNFDNFLKANQSYSEITEFTLLQAADYAFGEQDLCKKHTTRVLWLMKKLKGHLRDNLQSAMTPMDNYILGATYMREATRLLVDPAVKSNGLGASSRELIDKYNEKTFKYFERVVKAENTIAEEGLLDCYIFLSAPAFKKGLYQDQIFYATEFLRLNKKFNIFTASPEERGGSRDIQGPLFKVQHDLAKSYALCNQYDKAIETYKAILADDHLYSDDVKKMDLDELFILFSVYQSVQDIPTSQVLEALIKKTLPRLDAKVMRQIRTHLNREEKKPQSSNKKKNNASKPKKTNKDEMSDYMRARFITERVDSINRLCKISIGRCQILAELAKKNDLENETVNSLLSLENTFIEAINLVSQLKGTSRKDALKPLINMHTTMNENQSKLKLLEADLKAIISEQVRLRKQQAPSRASAAAMETKQANPKAEVMAAHAETKVKEKTRGEARPSAVAPKSAPIQNEEEAEAQDNKFGNIISCSDEVALILDTQLAWDLPASSVECLNILKNAKNIKDLQETLKVRKAKLKILRGKNEGVWQFRVNDKIRIRFNLVEGRFTNVQIGDFH